MKTLAAVIIGLGLAIAGINTGRHWELERHVYAQSGSSPCNQTVSISTSGAATIATAVPGATVYVCSLVITADTIATTGQFTSGSTNLTGAMRMCDECNIAVGDGTSVLFQAPPGGALTFTAVTGAVTGFVRIGQN